MFLLCLLTEVEDERQFHSTLCQRSLPGKPDWESGDQPLPGRCAWPTVGAATSNVMVAQRSPCFFVHETLGTEGDREGRNGFVCLTLNVFIVPISKPPFQLSTWCF